MAYEYSDPTRESEPTALPDIEVFELTAADVASADEDLVWEYLKRQEFRLATMNARDRDRMIDAMIEEQGITGGWYWQACFPGCLTDGDPVGPFASRREALDGARSNYSE